MNTRLIAIAILLTSGLGLVWALYHRGEIAGSAKVTAQVQEDHGKRMAEVRTDEHAAQAATARIGERTARADAITDIALQNTIEDLRHALDATPVPPAGGPLPAAPVDGMRASLNALVDRANRAADAAGAGPEAHPG